MTRSTAQQHLDASLLLFERLGQERGLPACHARLRQLLSRALPANAGEWQLKYDFYVGRKQGSAWGVTINDAHEGPVLAREALRFARSLGQGYRLEALQAVAQRLRTADVSLTFAIGFDAPTAAPRLKFYFQEPNWHAGVLRWAGLTPLLAELIPNFELPALVPPSRSVGVLAVDLLQDGNVAAKVYLGDADPRALCASAPAEVRALADAMQRACPMPGQFYYLTVRAQSGAAPSYAINKIYDVTALASNARTDQAWSDAAGLFELTGEAKPFDRLRRLTDGMVALPTATALETESATAPRMADLYVAAVRLAP